MFIHGTIEYDFSVSMNFVFDNFYEFLSLSLSLSLFWLEFNTKNQIIIKLYIKRITFDFIINDKFLYSFQMFKENLEEKISDQFFFLFFFFFFYIYICE